MVEDGCRIPKLHVDVPQHPKGDDLCVLDSEAKR